MNININNILLKAYDYKRRLLFVDQAGGFFGQAAMLTNSIDLNIVKAETKNLEQSKQSLSSTKQEAPPVTRDKMLDVV